ncbi:hypothetical protein K504DRAFT_536427 [Pleomassaria siparia CBS 279.74]|uniref:Luciferase domain-containing protein n=1 Tax=Pleomassaria siparia CBS 279.74 TaxID=1314801 RepID=A0A6G1JZZ1_9PLEO|nr:hypothetical protein K504DRAFT_536427 [Pleomassaria siparia CBS 279.74]
MASSFVIATLCVAGLALWADFKSWKRSGTGGTPPTFSGYLRIRRWGLYLFCKRQNLLDSSSISSRGPEYLSSKSIPLRSGTHPKLTRWTLPQRQHSEPITPDAFTTLSTLMQDFANTRPYSSCITTAPSKTEGGTGHAIYVNSDVDTINPVAHKIFYELAHVHPSDNSLHVYVSSRDAKTVIEKGWGQMFPVTWLAPESWIMVYAPRDGNEVKVVREIVRAAICFAVGQELRDE